MKVYYAEDNEPYLVRAQITLDMSGHLCIIV